MSFPQQDPQLEKRYSGKLLLSYIGSVNLSVALDKVIKAMPKIISAVPNAHLLILGEGSQIPELHQMITMFSLEQYVSFESWQPLSHIPSYMAVSSVGLLPFKPDEHHQSTVSHKLFQYMYMCCPVMASECKALIRIIADARCGRVVKGSMEISSIFAKDVITLLKDENLRYDMGCRGRRAVLANYRWTEDGDRLAELYQRLEASQTTKKLFQKAYD